MSLKDDLLSNLGVEVDSVDDNLPWESDNRTNDYANNKEQSIIKRIAKIDLNKSKNKLFLGALALLVFCCGFAIYNYINSKGASAINYESDSEQTSTSELTIHIGGAVKNSGVYKLQRGSRIMDAVNMAGGLLDTADADQINLAKTLDDGEQIIIPSKISADESGQSSSGDTASANNSNSQSGKININTADSTQLQTLSGIGPSTAQKIIDYRNANGKFKSIEDLKKVSGIGEKTYAKFCDKICV